METVLRGHSKLGTAAGRPGAVWAVIAVGTIVRLILAFATHGEAYDMHSLVVVRADLASYGIDVYRYVNLGGYHWPYPPALFPWIALSGAVAGSSAHILSATFRLAAIAADAAIAWLVADHLRWRGCREQTRVAGAAVVAFGPVFVIVSGFQGQFDSLAILPAVIALVVWERIDSERRALVAGALIGLGGALKTVPLLMVLALAPSARSPRELLKLAVAAAAVPLLSLIPFLVATWAATVASLRNYHGLPGQGGLSLLAQPDLSLTWLLGPAAHPAHYGYLTRELVGHASLLSYGIVAGAAAVLARFRPGPALAATFVWLAVFAFGPGFFFQYLIWGLPFFVLAGYTRFSAALQLAVLLPMAMFYFGFWQRNAAAYVYVPIMLAVWVATVVALLALVRGMRSGAAPSDLRAPAALALQ